jgi:hypothetical protein
MDNDLIVFSHVFQQQVLVSMQSAEVEEKEN